MCGRLGVKLKFMTVDLHESRDLIAVTRQIWALAAVARKMTTFPGPQVRCGAVRCGAVRCGEVRCGEVR
jgi:hypothetical protein